MMKYMLITLISVSFLFSACSADEKLELKDQKDKESYSLGYQLGENFKNQGVDINLEAYAFGVRDALGGKEPKLSAEEIRSTITSLSQRVMAAQQKTLQ